MKERTLIADRRYFGLDAVRLRAAARRVLTRAAGITPEQARITARHVRQDFELDTVRGQVLVDEFVAYGLLHEATHDAGQYRPTRRFEELAAARVVPPLSRSRARLLIEKAIELAHLINARWSRNPLAIDRLATYGSYMSREPELPELSIGIIVGLRPPSRRARFLRAESKDEGIDEIRNAYRSLSSYVRVRVVNDAKLLPRPFAIVFDDES